MAVVLVGTLDTKGDEVAFVRDLLHAAGVDTWSSTPASLGPPASLPDMPREEVFTAAGTTLTSDSDRPATAARRWPWRPSGAAKVVGRLHARGRSRACFGLGGSAGTTIGTAAMRALPFGVPKLMVSTLASGQVQPYVGVRDICMMHSVVDISGLNRISRTVLANAAAAMVGMVRREAAIAASTEDKPLVTATMFGVTTPCVEAARKRSRRPATRCWSSTPPAPAGGRWRRSSATG